MFVLPPGPCHMLQLECLQADTFKFLPCASLFTCRWPPRDAGPGCEDDSPHQLPRCAPCRQLLLCSCKLVHACALAACIDTLPDALTIFASAALDGRPLCLLPDTRADMHAPPAAPAPQASALSCPWPLWSSLPRATACP